MPLPPKTPPRPVGQERDTPPEGHVPQFRADEAGSRAKSRLKPLPERLHFKPLDIAGIDHQLAGVQGVVDGRQEMRYQNICDRQDAQEDGLRHVERAILDLRRDEDDRHAELDKTLAALTTTAGNAVQAAQNAANASLATGQSLATFEGVVLREIGNLSRKVENAHERLDDQGNEVTNTKLRVDLHDKVLTKPQAAGLAVGGLSVGAILPVIIRAVIEALK